MNCPHCNHELTDEQIRSLWASRNSGKRAVKTGGRNGGRPMNSMKTYAIYETIPGKSKRQVNEHLATSGAKAIRAHRLNLMARGNVAPTGTKYTAKPI